MRLGRQAEGALDQGLGHRQGPIAVLDGHHHLHADAQAGRKLAARIAGGLARTAQIARGGAHEGRFGRRLLVQAKRPEFPGALRARANDLHGKRTRFIP